MYLWKCDKRRFVDFLTNRVPLNASDVRNADTIDDFPLSGEEVLLVWQKSPADTYGLPRVAIVAEGSQPNFLAWVSTYFRYIRPFTAHCRVLTPSLANAAHSTAHTARLDLRSADVGLIISEGVSYLAGRADLARLPFAAFARTLSFALAEGTRRYSLAAFEEIKRGWLSVRDLAQQSPLELAPGAIGDVWSVIVGAVAGVGPTRNVEALIVEAIRGVRADGRVPRETWKNLTARIQKSELGIEALEGPREVRVKMVENAIRELARGPQGLGRERAFVAGYMASRI